MRRVIDRWKVHAGQEDAFTPSMERPCTRTLCATCKGAERRDPSECIDIAWLSRVSATRWRLQLADKCGCLQAHVIGFACRYSYKYTTRDTLWRASFISA
jgi:hypothetical protein